MFDGGGGTGVLVTGGTLGVLVGGGGGAGVLVGGTGAGVLVGGGAGAPTATKLAASQYMSLCLLAKSGLVRIKTVMVLSWATASTVISPQRSIWLLIEPSPDQTTLPEKGSQLPVGSIPIRR